MGRLGCFTFGLILGGTSVFISLKYHIIRASDGHHLIGKLSAEFGETYVDIRSFGIGDWTEHQALAAAITRAEKTYLLKNEAVESIRNTVNDYLDVRLGQPQQ